jgi:hypothetical protein
MKMAKKKTIFLLEVCQRDSQDWNLDYFRVLHLCNFKATVFQNWS